MHAWGRRLRTSGALLVFGGLSACADPNAQGRGLLEGRNAVFALSAIFVAAAVGLILGLVALDRVLQNRRRLAELGATPEAEPEGEEAEEVVAGIRVANARVPRWLYAAYLVLPLFALGYVMNAAELAPRAAEETDGTPAPVGPAREIVVVAQNVQFDSERYVVAANTEIKLTLDNRDSVPHDWTLFTDESAAEQLFKTDVITAATRDFTFTAPAPGTYYFHCTVHPAMDGELVAEEPTSAPDAGAQYTTEVAAVNIQFDTDEIVLPADSQHELQFVNEDTVPHNISIYDSAALTNTIFEGELITAGETTYQIPTPPAGEYYFHCDVHPAMKGTVRVE
ncbi:MAG TPA: cupredoxin domain-containing protein [Actinomycetota bacterium]|nr:cupredoxin domain-containing protein [Actinomycetota bacterium]